MALVAEIKQGTLAPPVTLHKVSELFPQPAPPQGQARNGVASGARLALLIEPFGINGIDPDSLHLAEGFRHDLMASLIRFREWFVVSGSSLSAEHLASGRVSGAYCVAATAYRAGDAMSLVLTLREHESGIHVWSERFVLTLSNWFESQQQIVRQIAISLNVQISVGRLGRIAAEAVVSLPVYDLWLRGQAALHRFSPENWKTAARSFTGRDPAGAGFRTRLQQPRADEQRRPLRASRSPPIGPIRRSGHWTSHARRSHWIRWIRDRNLRLAGRWRWRRITSRRQRTWTWRGSSTRAIPGP